MRYASGCPACANYGFNPSKLAYVYILSANVQGKRYYKFGIANDLDSRLKSLRNHTNARITVIDTWLFEKGEEARELERQLHAEHAADRYTRPDILASGNSELFVRDVLGLDEVATIDATTGTD